MVLSKHMLEGCVLNETWAEVRDATIAILERTTLATLAGRSGGRWTTPVPLSISPRVSAD